jgi:hypothetical protein
VTHVAARGTARADVAGGYHAIAGIDSALRHDGGIVTLKRKIT